MTRPADNSAWDRANCASWCRDTGHDHDPACWGSDHYVPLSMESGYPRDALPIVENPMIMKLDPPRIGANPYRREPGFSEVVYLHLYRPHHNDYLDLDNNLQLTCDEARRLAAHLVAVADEIGGAK